jgi:hypothetical protein
LISSAIVVINQAFVQAFLLFIEAAIVFSDVMLTKWFFGRIKNSLDVRGCIFKFLLKISKNCTFLVALLESHYKAFYYSTNGQLPD